MKAIEVYVGSDGETTKLYYARLEQCGPIGQIAVNLFRAQKCSSRAKVYHGGIRGKGRFKDMAYERKAWAMQNLAAALDEHGQSLGISYGWKVDEQESFASWVLYVDLPQGQVSFHSTQRFVGPDYAGEFDGAHKSQERILQFCDSILAVAGQVAEVLDRWKKAPRPDALGVVGRE